MSLLESLFSGLTGSAGNESVEHPCSNCPSTCSFCPDSCAVCAPYKTRLIDAIYNVEHIDEFRARYEVVDAVSTGGSFACPYCGAPSANRYTCEYCGMQLSEGTGKIQVTSASEIPNPILDAQDIIFERYEAVVKPTLESASSGGFLDTLLEVLSGDDGSSDTLGARMTEDEIKEAAKAYDVSVAAYLTGLDNGKYLTLSAKAAEDKRKAAYSAPTGMGAAGAGIAAGAAFNSLFSSGMMGGQAPSAPNFGYNPFQQAGRPPMPPGASPFGQGGQRPGTNSRPPQNNPRPATPNANSRPAQNNPRPATPNANSRPAQNNPRPGQPTQQSRTPLRPTAAPAAQPNQRPAAPGAGTRPAQTAQKPSAQKPAQAAQKPAQKPTATPVQKPSQARPGTGRGGKK